MYTNDRQGRLKERLVKFNALKEKIKERQEKCAQMITNEMGKPIKESRGEIEKGIKLIEFYIDKASEYLEDEQIKSKFEESYCVHQPLGPTLCKFILLKI